MLLDGREIAQEKEEGLRRRVNILKKDRTKPFLVSIVVGDENGARKYQDIKKKTAKGIGAGVAIKHFDADVSIEKIIGGIQKANEDEDVNGVMLQLPLPLNFSKEDREMLINAIDPRKDVDGMQISSPFDVPVVMAVIEVLKVVSGKGFDTSNKRVLVVGSKGFVGSRVILKLREYGYDVHGVDIGEDLEEKLLKADVIISSTGEESLIHAKMIGDNVAVIDLGFPKGDFTKEAYKKAVFASPSFGGVGPITVVCLLENLVTSTE